MLEHGRGNNAELKTSSNRPCQQKCSVRSIWVVIIGIFVGVLFFFSIAQAEVVIELQIIKAIESNGNPFAFNSRTKCYGLYQISEICLLEFNQINKTNYEPADLFNPFINETVASWYFKRLSQLLHFYSIPISIVTILASYNWGIGNVVEWYINGTEFEDLPEETRRYIERYRELTQKSLQNGERTLPYVQLSSYISHFPIGHS